MTDEMSNFEKSLQCNPNVEKRSIPVYLIKDLDLLKLSPYNRKITENSVQKFINLGIKPDVIYPVNQNGEILDGQHRIEACKRIGQAVLVQILHENDPSYIRDINSAGRVWTVQNHLQHACSLGYKDYIRLNDLYQKYPSVNLMNLIMVLSGSEYRANNKNLLTPFVKGTWKIRVSEKYAYPVLEFVTEILNNGIFLDVRKAYGCKIVNALVLFSTQYHCLRGKIPFFRDRLLRTLELQNKQSKLGKILHKHNNDFMNAFSDIASIGCRADNRFDYYGSREMFMQYLKAGQYL